MSGDDFDDDLADAFGTPRKEPVNRAPVDFKPRLEREDFVERCPACGGSGRWRGFRKCFKCDGTGRLTFKTSPEARAKGRIRAEEKRELRAELAVQWRNEHSAEIEWLERTAKRQVGRDKPWAFPAELLEKLAQYGTLTDGQLGAVHKCMLRDAERQAGFAEKRTSTVDAVAI